MFPNLLGQKKYFHLTDKEMGEIIGVSRNTYSRKVRTGAFGPGECRAYCLYFNKSFDYLFAIEEARGEERKRGGAGYVGN